MSIYPWQFTQWQRLQQQGDKLHHALLLTGEQGIGKQTFAEALVQSLLCAQPQADGMACNSCQNCHLLNAGNHPDFKRISVVQEDDDTDEDKKSGAKKSQILIHQIRELQDFLAISSHQGRKLILIHPAEAMNIAAANALLKMLEEPPDNAFFILLSHHYKKLPATIRSRCQQVNMPLPEQAIALQWLQQQRADISLQQLKYAGGSPLKALQLEEYQECNQLLSLLSQAGQMDIFQAVSVSAVLKMPLTVLVLQKWLHDLLASQQGIAQRYHSLAEEKMQALARQLETATALKFVDQLNYFARHSQHPLNQELQYESIFLNYVQLFKS